MKVHPLARGLLPKWKHISHSLSDTYWRCVAPRQTRRFLAPHLADFSFIKSLRPTASYYQLFFRSESILIWECDVKPKGSLAEQPELTIHLDRSWVLS